MELSNQGSKDEPARWASVALARPVRIQYKGYFSILNGCLFVLTVVLCAGIIAANGLEPVSLLVVTLNVLFLLGFLFIQLRGKRQSATLFEASGVTCGDGRRMGWNEFRGVDYLLVKRSPTRTTLWRVELVFAGRKVWILPNRVQNWEEIKAFVAALPGVHQERPA